MEQRWWWWAISLPVSARRGVGENESFPPTKPNLCLVTVNKLIPSTEAHFTLSYYRAWSAWNVFGFFCLFKMEKKKGTLSEMFHLSHIASEWQDVFATSAFIVLNVVVLSQQAQLYLKRFITSSDGKSVELKPHFLFYWAKHKENWLKFTLKWTKKFKFKLIFSLIETYVLSMCNFIKRRIVPVCKKKEKKFLFFY